MRRLLSFFAALAVVGLLAAPVAAAAPLENGWDTWTGAQLPDQCTGEIVDNSGSVHTVILNNYVHQNVQFVGTGESSGITYIGHNSTATPLPVHPSADGTFTATALISLRVTSTTSAANQILTIRDIQVFDSNGNLISDTLSFAFDCRA